MRIWRVGGGLGAVAIAAIVLAVRIGMSDAKVGHFGEETRIEFLASIAGADVCAGDQRAYVEWLALTCHDECWKNNHDLEPAGRRRTDVVIDMPGYSRDMLTAMADMARRENAPHIAQQLANLQSTLFPPE